MFYPSSSNYVAEIVFLLFEGGAAIQYTWLKTGLDCLIAIGLIIFDRQLWFAQPTPSQAQTLRNPVIGRE